MKSITPRRKQLWASDKHITCNSITVPYDLGIKQRQNRSTITLTNIRSTFTFINFLDKTEALLDSQYKSKC